METASAISGDCPDSMELGPCGLNALYVMRAFLGNLLGDNYCMKCMELGLEMLNTLGWKPGLVIYWATGFSHHCLRPLIIHQTLSRVMPRGTLRQERLNICDRTNE